MKNTLRYDHLSGLPPTLEHYRFSLDLLGNLYISVPSNRTVGVIRAGTNTFAKLAGTGGNYCMVGSLEKTSFVSPRGIEAMDFEWQGRVWVCDESAHRVIVIDPSKNESRVAAGCGRPGTRKDGAAKVCEIDSPKYIYRLTSRPILFIGQRREDSFRLFNFETNMVTTLRPAGPLPGPIEKTIPQFLYGPEQLVLHSAIRSKPYVIDIAEEKVLDAYESVKFPSKASIQPVVSSPFLPAWQYASSTSPTSPTSSSSSTSGSKSGGSGGLGSPSSPASGKVTRYDTLVFPQGSRPNTNFLETYKAMAYVPHTKRLYLLSKTGHIFSTTQLDPAPPDCPFISKPEVPAPNLSLLINTPLLLSDVLVENDLFRAHWNLHRNVVQPYINSVPSDASSLLEDKISKLQSVIKRSTLPLQSLEAFMCYLYLAPLVLTTDITQSCLIASHIAFLHRELGIVDTALLREFETKIARKLEPSDLCTALLDVWNDTHVIWTVKDPVIHVLAWHVRKRAIKEFKKRSSFLTCTRDAEIVALLAQEVPRGYLFSTHTRRSMLAFDFPVRHSGGLIQVEPGLTPKCPTDVLFLCKSSKEGYYHHVTASLLPLVPQWDWIRRMLEFGGSENGDRVIFVPEWMTYNVLLAILEPMYGPLLPKLTDEEAFSIIECAAEVDLVGIDGEPKAPFESLLKYCNEVSFPVTTNLNIVDQIIKYQRLGNQAKVDELMNAMWNINVLQHIKTLVALPMDLLQVLKARHEKESASLDIAAATS